jgi:hypothetical protein
MPLGRTRTPIPTVIRYLGQERPNRGIEGTDVISTKALRMTNFDWLGAGAGIVTFRPRRKPQSMF